MQTEPTEADPPKRKRRWFQFSLRTLLLVVVPYVAVYAVVLSSILSDHGKPKPMANELKIVEALRMALHDGLAAC
jgi:hypothetical protein